MMIAFFPTSSIRSIGLYLTCWMGSHEELFRLRPVSLCDTLGVKIVTH
jgi:hypothetical protein